MFRAAALGTMLAGVWLSVAACEDDATPHPCTNIPAGGCPLSHGVACEDPACSAIYLCLPNDVWQLDHPCPPHEAGASPVASDASLGDSSLARAPLFDANVDAPPGAFGGPGCQDLESPECSVGIALSCGTGCCGCEDLFVCQQGGWDLWGACRDGGVVHGN